MWCWCSLVTTGESWDGCQIILSISIQHPVTMTTDHGMQHSGGSETVVVLCTVEDIEDAPCAPGVLIMMTSFALTGWCLLVSCLGWTLRISHSAAIALAKALLNVLLLLHAGSTVTQ